MAWMLNAASLAMLAAGAAVGSVIAMSADRLHAPPRISWNLSRCRSCGAPNGTFVSRASLVVTDGSCRACGAIIPRAHFIAECAGLAITAGVLLVLPTERLIVGMLLAWALFALVWFDLQHWRLPNILTVGLAIAGLTLAAWTSRALFIESAFGATAGYVGFAVVGAIYRSARGIDGLGGGDVKLLGAAGAWVGWHTLPFVLLLSCIGALAWSVLTGRMAANDRLPFGAFLAAGLWVGWAWL